MGLGGGSFCLRRDVQWVASCSTSDRVVPQHPSSLPQYPGESCNLQACTRVIESLRDGVQSGWVT